MVYSCKRESHGVYRQIGDSTDPFIPGMSQRLLLQFRLVPFSISPHTAKGRLKHLCAFLVPSLRLINYVLPQRGHREAQRFLELGLRPKPQTHCRRQPKTSLRPPCALSVANQLCLATKGAQGGTKVFRVGAPPQTPDHDAGKRGAK